MAFSFRDFPKIKQTLTNNEIQDSECTVLIQKEEPRLSIGGLERIKDACC